jgi:hypothetical protein
VQWRWVGAGGAGAGWVAAVGGAHRGAGRAGAAAGDKAVSTFTGQGTCADDVREAWSVLPQLQSLRGGGNYPSKYIEKGTALLRAN